MMLSTDIRAMVGNSLVSSARTPRFFRRQVKTCNKCPREFRQCDFREKNIKVRLKIFPVHLSQVGDIALESDAADQKYKFIIQVQTKLLGNPAFNGNRVDSLLLCDGFATRILF